MVLARRSFVVAAVSGLAGCSVSTDGSVDTNTTSGEEDTEDSHDAELRSVDLNDHQITIEDVTISLESGQPVVEGLATSDYENTISRIIIRAYFYNEEGVRFDDWSDSATDVESGETWLFQIQAPDSFASYRIVVTTVIE